VPIRNLEATLAYFLSIFLNIGLMGVGVSSLIGPTADRPWAQAGADVGLVALGALIVWRLSPTIRRALRRVAARSLAFVGIVAGLVSSVDQKMGGPTSTPRAAQVLGGLTLTGGLVAGFLPAAIGTPVGGLSVFFAAYMLFGIVVAIVKSRIKHGG
jgi:hypothetical protein